MCRIIAIHIDCVLEGLFPKVLGVCVVVFLVLDHTAGFMLDEAKNDERGGPRAVKNKNG